jgi:hypothetical protein
VYGLALQDLTLPATIDTGAGNPPLVARGALPLSPVPNWSSRTIMLPERLADHALLLATTLEDDAAIPDGAAVANVTLYAGKTSQTIFLHKGQQVDDWRRTGGVRPPPIAAYTTGFRWTKLVDLVGQESYPEAYRQFTAGIAVTRLPLTGQRFTNLTLRYIATGGTLYVWAAAVQ